MMRQIMSDIYSCFVITVNFFHDCGFHQSTHGSDKILGALTERKHAEFENASDFDFMPI
jgi:hypothetical protein